MTMRGRIHFESAPWAIDLDPLSDERAAGELELATRLGDARGHALTHVGRLTRIDGGTFDVDGADEVLDDLARTLSFARAAFTTPLLRVGYDATDKCVWRCLSAFRTDPWNVHGNWFSPTHPEILQSVFAGWRRLSTSKNIEVIHAAANLYIDSHSVGLATESKLTIAQAALEGLAAGWPFLPLAGAPPVPTPPNGPTAGQRIGEIAVSLGLPLVVPPSLVDLAALGPPSPTATAQEKMTWVRNSIAHLGNLPRLAGHPTRIRYEARQLTTLHLELALLRLLDADGLYLDRLTATSRPGPLKLPWKP